MPPFELDADAAAVAALVPLVPPIPIVGGRRDRFGARRTVPVVVLRDSLALRSLHSLLVDVLEAAGATIRDQHHLRAGYRAHVTEQRGGALHPGEHATISELSVVARAPHSLRRVEARIPLRP